MPLQNSTAEFRLGFNETANILHLAEHNFISQHLQHNTLIASPRLLDVEDWLELVKLVSNEILTCIQRVFNVLESSPSKA